MKLRALITLAAVLISSAAAFTVSNRTAGAVPRVSYQGYRVHKVVPRTQRQLEALHDLQAGSSLSYNFWTYPSALNRDVDLMVAPGRTGEFRNFLQFYGLQDTVTVEDVQAQIDGERSRDESGPRPRAPEDFTFNEYHNLADINEWLQWLPGQYPGVVTPILGGSSYEERDIVGVKVSYGPDRRGVFIESGIHAREWIAPATVVYVLNQFLTSTNRDIRNLAEGYDWYFFPSVNPDGYVYTWETDRMWRKTRKPYGAEFGADPNRNWDYHWMEGGSSADPSEDIFAGDAPFSEIETQSLSEYIASIADTLDVYLSFHSYSQLILIPFGHQGLELPANNDELLRIAHATAKAMYNNDRGYRFAVGNIPTAIYIASGGSIDWVKGVYPDIRLVYCFELRPLDSFVLPPTQIIPSGNEILVGLIEMFAQLEEPESSTPGGTSSSPPPSSSNPSSPSEGSSSGGSTNDPVSETTPDGAAIANFNLSLLAVAVLYLVLDF